MSENSGMSVIQKQAKMFKGFTKILFDPAGILGAFGTVMLGVFSFLSEIPSEYPGIAGALLIGVSIYQKIMQTKHEARISRAAEIIADERAKNETYIAAERMRVLKKYEAGEIDEKTADFLLNHLLVADNAEKD